MMPGAGRLVPARIRPQIRSPRTPALARAIVRGRLWIALAWAVAAVVLAPLARQAGDALDVAGNRTGKSAAAEVERRLASDFASPFARYALLVITGIPSPDSADGRAVLREIAATIDSMPGVAQSAVVSLDARHGAPQSTRDTDRGGAQ